VLLQFTFCRNFFLTNPAFKRGFLFFMHKHYGLFKYTFLTKFKFTNLALKWFLWITLICCLSVLFWPNFFAQIWHLNGFCFSWTIAMCLSRILLCPNSFLEVRHLNGFCFSWTVFMCFFRKILCPKFKLHKQIKSNLFAYIYDSIKNLIK
jgi:hypothetical protein